MLRSSVAGVFGASGDEGGSAGLLQSAEIVLLKVGGFGAFMFVVARRVLPWVCTGSRIRVRASCSGSRCSRSHGGWAFARAVFSMFLRAGAFFRA